MNKPLTLNLNLNMNLHLIDTVSSSALLAEIYQHRDGWYAVRYYCRIEGGGKRELPASLRRFPKSCAEEARASAEKFCRCASTH